MGGGVTRTIVFWYLYWGLLILGNYPMSSILFGDTMVLNIE